MVEYQLKVNKENVYQEVSKTTSYTGKKMKDDPKAYDRIYATKFDREMLERFWNESKNTVCNSLKKFMVSEGESGSEYVITLALSSSFDETLLESMNRSLFSFMVMNIAAKWYVFTNKEEAQSYSQNASSMLEDLMRKTFFKKKPQRPTYH